VAQGSRSFIDWVGPLHIKGLRIFQFSDHLAILNTDIAGIR